MSFERWRSVGWQLPEISISSAWCLGDWLVYGEAAYDGRYREAVEQASLDYQTLRNYAWVAKFALSRRRDSLSFGHHAEVAALPEAEQDFWLRKAEELSWAVKRLRREVRASLSERSSCDVGGRPGAGRPGVPGPVRSSVVQLQVHLTLELGALIPGSRAALRDRLGRQVPGVGIGIPGSSPVTPYPGDH